MPTFRILVAATLTLGGATDAHAQDPDPLRHLQFMAGCWRGVTVSSEQ